MRLLAESRVSRQVQLPSDGILMIPLHLHTCAINMPPSSLYQSPSGSPKGFIINKAKRRLQRLYPPNMLGFPYLTMSSNSFIFIYFGIHDWIQMGHLSTKDAARLYTGRFCRHLHEQRQVKASARIPLSTSVTFSDHALDATGTVQERNGNYL